MYLVVSTETVSVSFLPAYLYYNQYANVKVLEYHHRRGRPHKQNDVSVPSP